MCQAPACLFIRYNCIYAWPYAFYIGIYARHASDGRFSGPGVSGIPHSDLEIAIAELTATRNGIDAWFREGGMSWIPKSIPKFGKVTAEMWASEERRQLLPQADDDVIFNDHERYQNHGTDRLIEKDA